MKIRLGRNGDFVLARARPTKRAPRLLLCLSSSTTLPHSSIFAKALRFALSPFVLPGRQTDRQTHKVRFWRAAREFGIAIRISFCAQVDCRRRGRKVSISKFTNFLHDCSQVMFSKDGNFLYTGARKVQYVIVSLGRAVTVVDVVFQRWTSSYDEPRSVIQNVQLALSDGWV